MLSSEKLKAQKKAIEHLLDYCCCRLYPARSVIARPGDVGDSLFFVLKGSVSILVEDKDSSRELVLAYVNKNEFIGTIGLFKGVELRRVTIRARFETQLAEIRYDHFEQLLQKDLKDSAIDIVYVLAGQLANRLLVSNRKFIDLAFMDVEERVLLALMELCQQPGAITHPEGMQITISRQEIGRIVGCSREMAGRVIKELVRKKIIAAQGMTIVVFGTR